jgi:hypothetical protein
MSRAPGRVVTTARVGARVRAICTCGMYIEHPLATTGPSPNNASLAIGLAEFFLTQHDCMRAS